MQCLKKGKEEGNDKSAGAAEHGDQASGSADHAATPECDAVGSSQELTLDDVISLFKESLQDRPKDIFAAALSLRDTKGRDRQHMLRQLASKWGRQTKREERWNLEKPVL